jgi:hypothetical protein
MVQASLNRKQDPISKVTTAKRVGGMTQVIENLPSKNEALSSNLTTTGKKKCHFVLMKTTQFRQLLKANEISHHTQSNTCNIHLQYLKES